MTGSALIAFGSAVHLQEVLALPEAPKAVPFDCLSSDATTQHRALALKAITRSLARSLPVRIREGRESTRLIITSPDPDRPESAERAAAREVLSMAYDGRLTGVAPANLGRGPDGLPRVWAEQLRLWLEWRLGTLWLLFAPTTWVSAPAEPTDIRAGRGDPASAWRKEQWVNRRNEAWADILGGWAGLIATDEPTQLPAVLDTRATDVTGGHFLISKTTAYSKVAR